MCVSESSAFSHYREDPAWSVQETILQGKTEPDVLPLFSLLGPTVSHNKETICLFACSVLHFYIAVISCNSRVRSELSAVKQSICCISP